MKSLHSIIQSLNPYAAYDKAQTAFLRKTLMCDNIKRLKIIGAIGSAGNLLLLTLYYLDDGLEGLTTIEATLRITWILATLFISSVLDTLILPTQLKKDSLSFFMVLLGSVCSLPV